MRISPEFALELLGSSNVLGIRVLNLIGKHLPSDKIIEIFRLLPNHPEIVGVNLQGHKIEDKAVKVIAEELNRKGTNIVYLSLSGCSLSLVSDTALIQLFEALKKNQTVTTIDLSGNHMGLYGIGLLSAALMENQTVTTIDLSDNHIGLHGVRLLSAALMENQTLTSLNLSKNSIRDEDVATLSEALMENHTVTHVDLSGNNIEDVGAVILLTALMENQTVTTIDLSCNAIMVYPELIIDLVTNKTVTTIDLSRNYLMKDVLDVLSKALKENPTVNLHIDLNTRESAGIAKIKKFTVHNYFQDEQKTYQIFAWVMQQVEMHKSYWCKSMYNRGLSSPLTVSQILKSNTEDFNLIIRAINGERLHYEVLLGICNKDGFQIFCNDSKQQKMRVPIEIIKMILSFIASADPFDSVQQYVKRIKDLVTERSVTLNTSAPTTQQSSIQLARKLSPDVHESGSSISAGLLNPTSLMIEQAHYRDYQAEQAVAIEEIVRQEQEELLNIQNIRKESARRARENAIKNESKPSVFKRFAVWLTNLSTRISDFVRNLFGWPWLVSKEKDRTSKQAEIEKQAFIKREEFIIEEIVAVRDELNRTNKLDRNSDLPYGNTFVPLLKKFPIIPGVVVQQDIASVSADFVSKFKVI